MDKRLDEQKARVAAKGEVFTPAWVCNAQNSDPIVAPKGSVCSQTFIYAKFHSALEAENFAVYLKTRFFRALVSARKITQDALSKVYSFVPVQDFTRAWTDADRFDKYGLDDKARAWIEKNIRAM